MVAYPDGGTDDDDVESGGNDKLGRPEFSRVDRERAILTESDRQFLLGEKELSENAERNARYRIRKRTVNGILDIAFLNYFLREEDMTQIFESEKVQSNLTPYLMFIYDGLQLSAESNEKGIDQFSDLLESAIKTIERNKNEKLTEITFKVNREDPNPEELFNKVISGNATMAELTVFMDVGDTSKLAEMVRNGEQIMIQMGEEKINATSFIKDILPYSFEDDEEDDPTGE